MPRAPVRRRCSGAAAVSSASGATRRRSPPCSARAGAGASPWCAPPSSSGVGPPAPRSGPASRCDAAAVYAHFRGRLPQCEREQFFVLLLDGRNRLIAELRISEGTLTAALVHPREVFAAAIRLAAAALVLVHNHPSGDPTPSAEDAALTDRLRRAGDLLGIRVLDHVVVGQGRFVSRAETQRW